MATDNEKGVMVKVPQDVMERFGASNPKEFIDAVRQSPTASEVKESEKMSEIEERLGKLEGNVEELRNQQPTQPAITEDQVKGWAQEKAKEVASTEASNTVAEAIGKAGGTAADPNPSPEPAKTEDKKEEEMTAEEAWQHGTVGPKLKQEFSSLEEYKALRNHEGW